MKFYIIRQGTEVHVGWQKHRQMQWTKHVTRQDLVFDRIYRCDGSNYTFRWQHWTIFVATNKVIVAEAARRVS